MERETFQRESMVRGYHVYGECWDPVVGEELQLQSYNEPLGSGRPPIGLL